VPTAISLRGRDRLGCVGGSLACLAAAMLCSYGVSLQAVIVIALPIVRISDRDQAA
jgi:hypothetical protein